ncbi:hypothetical protein [Microbacterium sp.]|uniref:hypothetical protein n=1 Tax=Microbacterium sp. TaxID=51671 RepID=UPI0025F6DE93|nr:hypothetical protein [Microbacterium sp.]
MTTSLGLKRGRGEKVPASIDEEIAILLAGESRFRRGPHRGCGAAFGRLTVGAAADLCTPEETCAPLNTPEQT